MAIRDLDDNPVGQRSIIFSRGKHLLEGFNLNKETAFESVVTTPIVYLIDRSQHEAIVQLPPITPGKNFIPTWTYPYYRFRINLGIIRDLKFVEKAGYQVVMNSVGYTENADSDWHQWKDVVPGEELRIQITDPVFDESCTCC